MRRDVLLSVGKLSVHYGHEAVVHDLSLDVAAGELVALIGPNGAGKTSTLRGVMGLAKVSRDATVFGPEMQDLSRTPTHVRARSGLAYIPETAGIFTALTVKENLLLGRRGRTPMDNDSAGLESVYDRWPILGDRREMKAGALSGGERQLLGIARALRSRPKVLLMDEPSLGLAPKAVAGLFENIDALLSDGLALLIVEQSIGPVLDRAASVLVIESGRIVMSGSGAELTETGDIFRSYLGG